MTNDGPFDLILVCTLWRDLVVSTPLLWSYITINESSSDYQVKLDVALALSGDLPPTVTLVLPLSTLKPFKDRLLRASSLHIHIDDIVDARPRDETLWDGDEAIEMMITLLEEADVRYEGPVTWYYSQDPVYLSTLHVHDKVNLRKERDPTAEVYFRSPYPIFHTFFSMSQIYGTTNLFRHLEAMVNLQVLHLCCNRLMHGDWSVRSTVVLPRLSKIILIDDPEHESPRYIMASGGDFVPWISAPALEQVGITAPMDSALDMIHYIYSLNCPSTLTLKISHQDEPYDREGVCDGLGYIRRIDIELPVRIDDEILRRLEQDVFQHISTSAICNIIINNRSQLPPNTFQELRCPLNIIFIGLHPKKVFQICAENTVNTVTFRTSGTTPKENPIPTCRRLHYEPSTARDIIHHPDSWPAGLEELDSGTSSFQNASLRNFRSTFSRLTTVTCTPQVALVLINRGLPSILQVLTLVSTREVVLNEKGFRAVANAFQNRLANDHLFGLNLTQLNVQYFPPWSSYLTLLHLIVQRRGQAVLYIEIPGLPHNSILTRIVSVLNGIPPVKKDAFYTPAAPKVYKSFPGLLPGFCGCYNSGFGCYPLPSQYFCTRFIDGRKVSVTKDTIPV